jgi:hypothetical protein
MVQLEGEASGHDFQLLTVSIREVEKCAIEDQVVQVDADVPCLAELKDSL